MEAIHNPEELRDEIRLFTGIVVKRQIAQESFNNFLEKIKPSLKVKVQNYVFSQQIKHNGVIKSIIEIVAEEEKNNLDLAFEQLNSIPGYK